MIKINKNQTFYMGFNKTPIFTLFNPFSKTAGATKSKINWNLPLKGSKIISTIGQPQLKLLHWNEVSPDDEDNNDCDNIFFAVVKKSICYQIQ